MMRRNKKRTLTRGPQSGRKDKEKNKVRRKYGRSRGLEDTNKSEWHS
jgi:hypothetical protein